MNQGRLSSDYSTLAKIWKTMSNGDKTPYGKMAEDDKKRYAEERASYRLTPGGRKFDCISDDLIDKYIDKDSWSVIPELLSFKREMYKTCCCCPGSAVFGQLVCTTDSENGMSTSIPLSGFKTKVEIDKSLGNFLPFYRALFGKEPKFGLHCQPSDCCSCT